LTESLTERELWEVNEYLEEKMRRRPIWQYINFLL
jgi:hypothetical protein